MMESKADRKTFTPSTFVTRLEYEAALSVIAQAKANGQVGDDGDTAESFYYAGTRLFKAPEVIIEENEASAQRLRERVGRYQAELDKAENAIRQAKAFAGHAPSNVVSMANGSAIHFDPVAREDSTKSTVIIGAGTVHEKHMSCSCAYSGFNFHVSGCVNKGPCR